MAAGEEASIDRESESELVRPRAARPSRSLATLGMTGGHIPNNQLRYDDGGAHIPNNQLRYDDGGAHIPNNQQSLLAHALRISRSRNSSTTAPTKAVMID